MPKQINYSKRTFEEVRSELYQFVQEYYPESLSFFRDSSVGAMLLDLNAAVGDNLAYHTDRMFQETQRTNAQQRRSVFEIARNLNFQIPSKKASVTVVDFTVSVPVLNDSFDISYCPIIHAGAQVVGGGKVFETRSEVDFGSAFSSSGTPNRRIIPVQDNLGRIVRYDLVKRELVYNGVTRVFKKIIGENENKPFLEILLQDADILEISSVIVMDGLVEDMATDTDYVNEQYQFHEVDYLAQQYKFVQANGDVSSEIKTGKWKRITKKFIKEYTESGFCKIIFGNGDADLDLFSSAIDDNSEFNALESYLYSTALGERPKVNSTLFIKYRVGGGSTTNVGAFTLTDMGGYTISAFGSIPQVNEAVKRSLTVNNPIPAFGGKDEPSIEEIKALIAYNNSAQGRCVTLRDYLTRVYMMDGAYGAPFKVTAFKEDNKVIIAVLGLDENGKLDNRGTTILNDNIAEYLSGYRMVNDYVEVRNGRIFNLAYDVELYVEDKINDFQVITNTINEVIKYHDINNLMMNQDVLLGNLIENINNVAGVLNVITLKVYNKTGTGYSPNQIEMELRDETTFEIEPVNNMIYSSRDAMFEIKEPTKDIRVTLRRSNQLGR